MDNQEIRKDGYGNGLLDPQVTLPHGNSFSILPNTLLNNERAILSNLCIPSSEICKNHNLQRTHVLKCQKQPKIHVKSKIQWGIHIYIPQGEIECAKCPKILGKSHI